MYNSYKTMKTSLYIKYSINTHIRCLYTIYGIICILYIVYTVYYIQYTCDRQHTVNAVYNIHTEYCLLYSAHETLFWMTDVLGAILGVRI